MDILLWIVTLTPFLGAFILAIWGARMPKWVAGAVGCATIGISWIAASIVAAMFLSNRPEGGIHTVLYTWMNVGGLDVPIGLHLDALSLVMMIVVTFVGFLIHLYSAQSMYDEDGYSRFFAYMNLFVGFMLTLVLANNLLFLFFGWEGVGLCSYLLIGFWYKDSANGRAAQKAFIVTRVGDLAFAVALFILFKRFGTLDIQTILATAPMALPIAVASVVGFLLLGGAVGKSAQVPLQTWLPDAMAGPSPVSALIHAATMVTAGVYLIARMHVIFQMAPAAQLAVAVVGTFTLFYSGFSALVQRDIKRVLAYSTISQVGYMFLALGVGAWTAAMFHFATHAFFKALLFLAAGVVIDAQHHEHDIFKMGGLCKKLPVACWTFFVGAAALAALPLVTAGFYSKDAIIWASYASELGNTWLWTGALIGALVTGIYAFRVWFVTFFGEQKIEVGWRPGGLIKGVLVVLAVFSLGVGFLSMPEVFTHENPFKALMDTVLPTVPLAAERSTAAKEWTLLGVSMTESLIGLYLASLYLRPSRRLTAMAASPVIQALRRFFFAGWGFDWLYEHLFVRPYVAIAYADRNDFIDWIYRGLAELTRLGYVVLSWTQTGRVRSYAAGIVLGAIVLTAIVFAR